MTNFTALFDANVLYSAPLRDLIVQLALTGHFRAKWSRSIHEEWIKGLLAKRPELKQKDLERTRDLMNSAVLDCQVEGYEGLIPNITLPDENDRHVLAAAIVCGAGVIVTLNTKDFPQSEVSKYNIEIQHPDDFVLNLLGLAPGDVCKSIHKIGSRLVNPPMSADGYLDILERQGLAVTVSQLKQYVSVL